MTWTRVGAVLYLVAGVIYLASALRMYRARQREAREFRRMADEFAETLRHYAPVLLFVATLRDSPFVPPELRRAAASVLPREVTITRDDGRVH